MEEPQQDAAGGTRGALIALVVLVLMLAVAFFGYHLLAGQADGPGSGSGQLAGSSGAAMQEDDEPGPQLARYDATVYDDDGVPATLTALADGKPLVINFWATWCPYCIQEMGDFQEIYDGYSSRVAFAFVDATDGRRETVEDARAWMEESGYRLPVYYDTAQEAVRAFGVQAFPTTVVVAADGEIQTISPGVIDPQLMRHALDSLL